MAASAWAPPPASHPPPSSPLCVQPEYFRIRLVRLPVGPDYRLSAAAVARAVGRNTVLVVASAPGFPHGVVDHVEAIAQVGFAVFGVCACVCVHVHVRVHASARVSESCVCRGEGIPPCAQACHVCPAAASRPAQVTRRHGIPLHVDCW